MRLILRSTLVLLLSLSIITSVLTNAWAKVKQLTYVEVKAVDGKVVTVLNLEAPYKAYLDSASKKLTLILKNVYVALDQREADINYGPVQTVSFSQKGTDAVVNFKLTYPKPNYKIGYYNGYTIISVSFPKLPEPPGPSAVKAPEKVRKVIKLTGTPKKLAPEKPATVKPSVKTTPKPAPKEENLGQYAPKKAPVVKVVERPVEKKIDLELVDASLVDVIRMLAYKYLGWNLIIDSEVKGQVTLQLRGVNPEKALRVILVTKGFDYRKIDNIVYVGPKEKVAKLGEELTIQGPTKIQVIYLENAKPSDIEATVKSMYPEIEVQAKDETNQLIIKAPVNLIPEIKEFISNLDVPPPPPPPVVPPTTEVIYLNYANADDVVNMMGELVSPDAIKVDKRLNALVVTATPDVIETVKNFVEAVDVPEPQVQLNLLVISISENGQKQLGIEWQRAVNFTAQETDNAGNTGPFANWGIQFFTRSGFQFQNALKFLVDRSLASILASPYISTVNGKKAEIHIGERIPIVYFDPRAGMFQAQYTNVGIILSITPYISHNKYVTLDLQPSVSEPGEFIQQYPRIQERSARTTVRVKSGDTVVIGGLIRQNDSETWKKVPFLSNIPILGEFFKSREKSKQKTELVIAVTPIVLQDLPKAATHQQYKQLKEKHSNQWGKH